jgi:hypothetical protein
VECFFKSLGRSRIGSPEAEAADGQAGTAEGGVGGKIHCPFPPKKIQISNFKKNTKHLSKTEYRTQK